MLTIIMFLCINPSGKLVILFLLRRVLLHRFKRAKKCNDFYLNCVRSMHNTFLRAKSKPYIHCAVCLTYFNLGKN